MSLKSYLTFPDTLNYKPNTVKTIGENDATYKHSHDNKNDFY